jgi:hypothetical protein
MVPQAGTMAAAMGAPAVDDDKVNWGRYTRRCGATSG